MPGGDRVLLAASGIGDASACAAANGAKLSSAAANSRLRRIVIAPPRL
jgi:hypothetical protein